MIFFERLFFFDIKKIKIAFFYLFCLAFVFCVKGYSDEQSQPVFLYKGYLTREPEIEKIYSAQKYDRYRVTFSIKNIGTKSWIGGLCNKKKDKVYLCLRINGEPLLSYVLPANVKQKKVIDAPSIISIPKAEGTFILMIGLNVEGQEQYRPRLVEVMQVVNYKDNEGQIRTKFITECQGKTLEFYKTDSNLVINADE